MRDRMVTLPLRASESEVSKAGLRTRGDSNMRKQPWCPSQVDVGQIRSMQWNITEA